MIRKSILALAAFPLAACVVVPDAPNVTSTPWPEGSAVKLKQSVSVGDVVVTPIRIVEDSRCPINARCVWAGRLVVETRIAAGGWRDTANITLGETYGTHGHVIALSEASPDKEAQRELQPGDYRLTYRDGAWNTQTDPGPPLSQ